MPKHHAMPIVLRKCYTIGMALFDDIYEIAADNYGLVTFAEVREIGGTSTQLRRFIESGRLKRVGQGVYKLVKYIPTPYDQYAQAVALVGPGSYIHGESVLAMHELALVNPFKMNVATPRRIRRNLPKWIAVVPADETEVPTCYEGIPSQSVENAIRFCRGRVMKERLVSAVKDAVYEGLIYEDAGKALLEELG